MFLKDETERQIAKLLANHDITTEQAKSLQAVLAKIWNELLDETEAGKYLRCSVKALQAWRGLRWGPCYTKLGRRVYYPRTELDKFIAREW